MRDYLIRRLLLIVPTLLGVSFVVFALLRLVPGDVVVTMIAETGNVSPKDMDALRARLGLDRPLLEQYLLWMSGVVRGDFGVSLWTGRPVVVELLKKLPVSLELAVLATTLALVISVPVGVVSAIRRNTGVDYLGRLFVVGGLSLPDFWLGTIVIVFPAIWWRYSAPLGFAPFLSDPITNLVQMGPPAVILGVRLSASNMRMARSMMLEVLRQDYIRTAWSKGLRERQVVVRHALRNAMIPVVTILGTQFSHLLGGTVIMESLFSLPGVGRFVLEGVLTRDYPVVQGGVMFIAVIMLSMNLVVDTVYAWLDPRIRFR